MTKSSLAIRSACLAAVCLATIGAAAPASAGPYLRYERPAYVEPVVGFVFRRHVYRCDYPHGFNVTDFVRDVNGTPRGGDALLAEGCGAFEPFSP